MQPFCQFGNGILDDPFAIRTCQHLVIAVQVVAAGGLVVNGEHDIVSDAASTDVHSTLVPQPDGKEGSRIDLSPFDEGGIVEEEGPNLRTDRVFGSCLIRSAHPEIQECPLCFLTRRVGSRIQVQLTKVVGVGDILRNGKGELEGPIPYRVVSDVECIII